MDILNYEFKARVENLEYFENKLKELKPTFIGTDIQVDTYFNVSSGRLKLREGNIENSLIRYHRENIKGAKQSDVQLYKCSKDPALKEILISSLGIKVVVKKERKIYFIDNVKFHFDKLDNLGTFLEVEAIDNSGSLGIQKLKQQAKYYSEFFGINESDYLSQSYSDMILDEINPVNL